MSDKTIVFYKGFDKDFRCRGYQYEVGKTYEHDGQVSVCESGFHACENPMDVWGYYSIADSRFAVVKLSGVQKSHESDTKIAAARIEIKAELTLPEFVNRAVHWVIDQCKAKFDTDSKSDNDSGYSAQIGSSGDCAQIGSSGNAAKIGSSGDYAKIGSSGYSAQIGSSGNAAKIGSSGYYAQIGSSGNAAKIGSSGYYAQIGSSGYYAQIGSSGDAAKIGSSGDSAKIGSSGDSAKINVEGEKSVVASAGRHTTITSVDGTWVSLAEYDDDGNCVGFATGCIGQDGLKADIEYRAQDGKLVPSED